MNLLSAPRQPCVGLALSAATGIVVADFLPIPSFALLLLVAFSGMLLWIWSRPILVYAFVAIGFFWIHSFHLSDSSGSRLAARLGNEGQAITVSGSVVGEPTIRPNGFASFLFKLSAIELDGKTEPANAIVFVRWRGQPKFGDELKLFGVLEPIQLPRNPGEFGWQNYLARLDVRRNIFVRYEEHGTIIRRGGGNVILRLAQKSRAWMQDALSRGLRDDRTAESVISGLSLGIVQETPDDIEEPFQETGTFHLFAVSGLNVAIVARLLWVLGILVRIPRRWTIALIIPALGFYAAITGLQTSSVRAAVMTSVLLLGFFAERKVLTLNSLAAAAFVILGWNTNELFSVGFQLSFAVVLAILLLAEPIFRYLRRWSAPDPFLPRSLLEGPGRLFDTGSKWVCRGAAVSLAAWLGSTPLILWNFHLVTPISLLANLVVVPIAFFVLAIALVSLLTTPLLPGLAIVFNHANWLLAHLLLWTVNLFAQIPGGHFYLELPPWSRPQTEMTVLDVGAGAAVHLRDRGHDWLFDCGSERDYEWLLRQYLRTRGVNRLDGLLLTHGDSLHIGAAGEVVKNFRPRKVVDNPLFDRSLVHRRLRAVFDRLGIRLQKPLGGERLKISHDIIAKVLFPPGNFSALQADDETIVLQLILFSSTRVLLVSDSGYQIERYLCEAGLDLRSDILIKGQHHSGESGSDAFLYAVQPRLIIATSRDFPAHQRVDDDWAARVRAKGIKLLRQDETGAVQLHFAPGTWEARSYLTGETFRSSSR